MTRPAGAGALQDGLVRLVLELLDERAPPNFAAEALAPLVEDEATFRAVAFASGLTAAIAGLAGRRAVALPPAWVPYAEEQAGQVAARQRRFEALLPLALGALHDAGVAALPVKGAVLATERWPLAGCRPMSDIDLLVAPDQRGRAAEALVAAGYPLVDSSDWEDTFLAWGDGSVGRTDGESAEHNGKIELHPGWVERLHNYLVSDGGALLGPGGAATMGSLAGVACLRLDAAAMALHVVGHLSATVIRAEVRPLHVIDALLCLEVLDDTGWQRFAALADLVDARLVDPGLWLATRYRPASVPAAVAERRRHALRAQARNRLAGCEPAAVYRDPARRTGLAWRAAFTTATAERLAMGRQALVPPASDRPPGGGPLGLGSHVRRAVRLAGRAR